MPTKENVQLKGLSFRPQLKNDEGKVIKGTRVLMPEAEADKLPDGILNVSAAQARNIGSEFAGRYSCMRNDGETRYTGGPLVIFYKQESVETDLVVTVDA